MHDEPAALYEKSVVYPDYSFTPECSFWVYAPIKAIGSL